MPAKKPATLQWLPAFRVIAGVLVSSAVCIYIGSYGRNLFTIKTAEAGLENFLYGKNLSIYPFLTALSNRKPRNLQCGGMDPQQIVMERNNQDFWVLDSMQNMVIIRPAEINLVPCDALGHAKFSVGLVHDAEDSIFHYPLGYAVPNETVPGVYHIHANLKPEECLPSRKYRVSAKLEYAFTFETPKDRPEFFGFLKGSDIAEQQLSFINESTPFAGSDNTVLDMTSFSCPLSNQVKRTKPCTSTQLEELTVYRSKVSLDPVQCTIPQLWPKDLTKSPSTLCNGKKCAVDQWIHFVGDSNTHYLFNQLVDAKFGIKNCYRGWYPAPVICFRDLPNRGYRRGDITILVYTNWYMFENSTQPRNAFEGLKLTDLFEIEPYKSILPSFKSKKEGAAFWGKIKDLGLPAKTFVSMGSHYDHQTPVALEKVMESIFERLNATDRWNIYKPSTVFVAETAVLTSQIPLRFRTLLHQNNARIAERNRVILKSCRKYGFKFIDIYGFGRAWNEWKRLGDALHFKLGKEGYVYNRVADTYLYELGFRPSN
ncbi:hypothetical protein BDR26DRAFT_876733 [Obelidium mucronatum]|nr:hypothetical protein BDR26DRAFT_876733 [Obelidium mucronatum]